MAAETIACGVCGAENDKAHKRCQSCGAKLEELTAVELSEDELHARRYAQDHFIWKWVFVALAVYVPLEAILLVALPKVISTYDPQGLPGILGRDGWLAYSGLCGRIPGLTTASRIDVHFWWNTGEIVLLLLASHPFLKERLRIENSPQRRKEREEKQ